VKLLTVVGNRPQFVKAAALSAKLASRHHEVLVHTGQHHDHGLSQVFFDQLELPTPTVNLGVSGGDNASQVGRMVGGLAEVLADVAPDAVLVYGDTNSTLAGSLAAALAPRTFKLERGRGRVEARAGYPLVHVEAGMRSGDWTMPEETNRVLCDQLATLLLCPTELARENLAAEGLLERPGRVAAVCGDVMADLALASQRLARERTDQLERFGLERGGYLLATVHRAANVDDPKRLRAVVELVVMLAARQPVVLPLHPRTRRRLDEAGLWQGLAGTAGVVACEPLPYLELQSLLCNARAVLTDSGGLQKEAYLAGVRCLTLRDRTEWRETVAAGWNTLVDLDPQRALAALERPLPRERPPLYGKGDAAQQCAAAIDRLEAALRPPEGGD